MSEEEAKIALFKIHYEYMLHTPKERLELYEQYKADRSQVKEKLKNSINNETNKTK